MGWRPSCSTPRRSRSFTAGSELPRAVLSRREGRAGRGWGPCPARGRGFRRPGARLHPGQLHDRGHTLVLDRVGDGRGRAGAGWGRAPTTTRAAGLIIPTRRRPHPPPPAGTSHKWGRADLPTGWGGELLPATRAAGLIIPTRRLPHPPPPAGTSPLMGKSRPPHWVGR